MTHPEISGTFQPLPLHRPGLPLLASRLSRSVARTMRNTYETKRKRCKSLSEELPTCSCGAPVPSGLLRLLHIDCLSDDRKVRKFRLEIDRVF